MNQNLKILLVEDDNNLGNLLCDYLNAKGHNCTLRTNGNDGYQSFIDETFDFFDFPHFDICSLNVIVWCIQPTIVL